MKGPRAYISMDEMPSMYSDLFPPLCGLREIVKQEYSKYDENYCMTKFSRVSTY